MNANQLPAEIPLAKAVWAGGSPWGDCLSDYRASVEESMKRSGFRWVAEDEWHRQIWLADGE